LKFYPEIVFNDTYSLESGEDKKQSLLLLFFE